MLSECQLYFLELIDYKAVSWLWESWADGDFPRGAW